MIIVKLQYFKPSGKYYADGAFETDYDWMHMWLIIDELKARRAKGVWDGLSGPCPEFHTLMLVPYMDGDTQEPYMPHLFPATLEK